MRLAPLALVVVLSACAEVDNPNPTVVLPEDYRTAFAQVHDCGNSIDHGLMDVIVRVRAGDVDRYRSGPYPFPKGTLIVKEIYRVAGCTDLFRYAVMRKEDPGYYPEGGDWQWFSLDAAGSVLESGKVKSCASCHGSSSGCGSGHDFSCPGP
jgi:hypothetical protein